MLNGTGADSEGMGHGTTANGIVNNPQRLSSLLYPGPRVCYNFCYGKKEYDS